MFFSVSAGFPGKRQCQLLMGIVSKFKKDIERHKKVHELSHESGPENEEIAQFGEQEYHITLVSLGVNII